MIFQIIPSSKSRNSLVRIHTAFSCTLNLINPRTTPQGERPPGLHKEPVAEGCRRTDTAMTTHALLSKFICSVRKIWVSCTTRMEIQLWTFVDRCGCWCKWLNRCRWWWQGSVEDESDQVDTDDDGCGWEHANIMTMLGRCKWWQKWTCIYSCWCKWLDRCRWSYSLTEVIKQMQFLVCIVR